MTALNITMLNPENVTGITGMMKYVNTVDSMYSLSILISFYVLLYIILYKFGAKTSFITTSSISLIICFLLMTIGIPTIWVFTCLALFIISVFVYIW